MSNQLALIHDNLNSLIKLKADALPKDFNQTRFIQNAMSVLQDTKDIELMEPRSIARTMLKGAFLGLDFFNKECYAIPYNKNLGTKDKPKWVKELQFQTDYKGEIKLVKKYSLQKIKDVYAKLVREGDVFTETVVGGQPSINFAPKPFNKNPVIGVFAICLYEDGSMIYEVMTTEDIDKVRDTFSKVATGKAWKGSWGEMAKKTVLRRLCKGIQVEFETGDATEAFDAGGNSEFTEYEDVTPEPIQMPEEKKEAAEPKDDKDKLTQIRELLTRVYGGDVEAKTKWLKEETSFTDRGSGELRPGKATLAALTPKQIPFVYRAAVKLVEEKTVEAIES